jgi:hypothetical protein
MGMECSTIREKMNECRILVEIPKGKRPAERSRRKWENYIRVRNRMGYMDWIHLAKDGDQWLALVNTVMNLWIP